MNSNLVCLNWTSTVVRHDKCEMPLSRDHRVRLIYETLGNRKARVSMDVSYDSQTLHITEIPELREARGSNVNVADQAFRIKVVKVGSPYHYRSYLSRMGQQKDSRFPFTVEPSLTEFLDRLLPQVEVNLNARAAGPKPSVPLKQRSKCPCNHRYLAFRARFEAAIPSL